MVNPVSIIFAAIILGMFIWLMIITMQLRSYTQRRKVLFRDMNVDQIEVVLAEIIERLNSLDSSEQEMREFQKQAKYFLRRSLVSPHILRYNAYENISGQQSFSLVLIDRRKQGLVLTSLVTREGTRLYIKPVLDGKCDSPLSEEELQSLSETIASLDTPN
jgi:hypothetical protein